MQGEAGAGPWPFRVVPDTNVFISAVHPGAVSHAAAAGFQQSPSEEFILRAVAEEFVLLLSLSAFLELAEKLEQLGVPTEAAQRLLEALRAIGEEVVLVTGTPFCTDPDDDKFVWAAIDGRATHLVTADRKLTRAVEKLPVRVMVVVGFLRELREQLKARKSKLKP